MSARPASDLPKSEGHGILTIENLSGTHRASAIRLDSRKDPLVLYLARHCFWDRGPSERAFPLERRRRFDGPFLGHNDGDLPPPGRHGTGRQAGPRSSSSSPPRRIATLPGGKGDDPCRTLISALDRLQLIRRQCSMDGHSLISRPFGAGTTRPSLLPTTPARHRSRSRAVPVWSSGGLPIQIAAMPNLFDGNRFGILWLAFMNGLWFGQVGQTSGIWRSGHWRR